MEEIGLQACQYHEEMLSNARRDKNSNPTLAAQGEYVVAMMTEFPTLQQDKPPESPNDLSQG